MANSQARTQARFVRVPKCVSQAEAQAAVVAEYLLMAPEDVARAERHRQCKAVAGVYDVQPEQARDIVALAEAVEFFMAEALS